MWFFKTLISIITACVISCEDFKEISIMQNISTSNENTTQQQDIKELCKFNGANTSKTGNCDVINFNENKIRPMSEFFVAHPEIQPVIVIPQKEIEDYNDNNDVNETNGAGSETKDFDNYDYLGDEPTDTDHNYGTQVNPSTELTDTLYDTTENTENKIQKTKLNQSNNRFPVNRKKSNSSQRHRNLELENESSLDYPIYSRYLAQYLKQNSFKNQASNVTVGVKRNTTLPKEFVNPILDKISVEKWNKAEESYHKPTKNLYLKTTSSMTNYSNDSPYTNITLYKRYKKRPSKEQPEYPKSNSVARELVALNYELEVEKLKQADFIKNIFTDHEDNNENTPKLKETNTFQDPRDRVNSHYEHTNLPGDPTKFNEQLDMQLDLFRRKQPKAFNGTKPPYDPPLERMQKTSLRRLSHTNLPIYYQNPTGSNQQPHIGPVLINTNDDNRSLISNKFENSKPREKSAFKFPKINPLENLYDDTDSSKYKPIEINNGPSNYQNDYNKYKIVDIVPNRITEQALTKNRYNRNNNIDKPKHSITSTLDRLNFEQDLIQKNVERIKSKLHPYRDYEDIVSSMSRSAEDNYEDTKRQEYWFQKLRRRPLNNAEIKIRRSNGGTGNWQPSTSYLNNDNMSGAQDVKWFNKKSKLLERELENNNKRQGSHNLEIPSNYRLMPYELPERFNAQPRPRKFRITYHPSPELTTTKSIATRNKNNHNWEPKLDKHTETILKATKKLSQKNQKFDKNFDNRKTENNSDQSALEIDADSFTVMKLMKDSVWSAKKPQRNRNGRKNQNNNKHVEQKNNRRQRNKENRKNRKSRNR